MLRKLHERMLKGYQPTDAEYGAAGVPPKLLKAAKGAGVPMVVLIELLIEYGPTAIAILKKVFPKWFGGLS